VNSSRDHEKEMRENGDCMRDCNRLPLENSYSKGSIRRSAGNVCIGFLNNFVVHVQRNGLKIYSVEKYLVRGLEGR